MMTVLLFLVVVFLLDFSCMVILATYFLDDIIVPITCDKNSDSDSIIMVGTLVLAPYLLAKQLYLKYFN